MKKLILGAFFALVMAAGTGNAAEIYFRFGPPPPPPPPPREVIVVRPTPRHVWVDGYYRWDGHKYKWHRGRWVVPPRGKKVWVPGRWERGHRGHIWIEGYWRH